MRNHSSELFLPMTAWPIRDTMESENSSMNKTVMIDVDVVFEGERLTHLERYNQDELHYIIMNCQSK